MKAENIKCPVCSSYFTESQTEEGFTEISECLECFSEFITETKEVILNTKEDV